MRRDGIAFSINDERIRSNDNVSSWDRAALWAARSLILCALLYASWRFGAVQSIALRDISLLLGAATLLVLTAPQTWRERRSIPLALPALALGFLAYGWLQALPLPELAQTTGFAKPLVASGEVELLNDAITQLGGEKVIENRRYGSVAAEETRQALVPFAIGFVILCLTAITFRTQTSRRVYALVLITNGALISLWAIIQRASGNPQILPGLDHAVAGMPFAGFVYKNAGAAALLVPLAMAVAYIVIRRKQVSKATSYGQQLNSASIGLFSIYSVIVLMAAGLLITFSRGAWISAIAAIVVVLSRRDLLNLRSVNWLGVLVGSAILSVIIAATGIFSQVTNHAGRLSFESLVEDSRWQHWKDGWRTALEYFPFGSGIGTYGFATLPQQPHAYRSWFNHAHNQYLETLVEVGLPGVLIVAAFVTSFGVVAYRLSRDAVRTEHRRWAMIAIALLVCGVTQSAIDFVLIVPANLILYASVIGLILSVAYECQRSSLTRAGVSKIPTGIVGRFRHWEQASRSLVSLAVLAVGAWAWYLSQSQIQGDRALAHTEVSCFSKAPPSSVEIATSIQLLDDALLRQPMRASLYNRRADWNLLAYRQELRSTAADQGVALPWAKSDLEVLFDAVVSTRPKERDSIRADLMGTDKSRQFVTQVLSDNAHSLLANPFLPQTHLTCAALSPLVDMPVHRWTRSAASLVNNSHLLLFRNGCYAARSGDIGVATDQWQKSLFISQQYIEPIYELALPRMSAKSLAIDLVPSSRPDMLIRTLRRVSETDPGSLSSLSHEIMRHVEADPEMHPGVRSATLAQIHEVMHRELEAVAAWKLAVQNQGRNADYRLQYANALRSIGSYDRALDQVVLGQAIRPDDKRFVRLASQLRQEIGQYANH